MIHEPISEPIVPINVMPPDNPCETVLNEVIALGFTLENFSKFCSPSIRHSCSNRGCK